MTSAAVAKESSRLSSDDVTNGRNFKRHLEEPRDAIFENDVASAVAFVRR